MSVRTSATLRNAALNGVSVASILDGDSGNATIELYSGSVNGTFGLAPGGTKAATCTLARPSFHAASSGSMTAYSIQSDISADASCTIACFVLKDSSGAIHADGSVSLISGGGDIQFDVVAVTAGDVISVSLLTISIPQS